MPVNPSDTLRPLLRDTETHNVPEDMDNTADNGLLIRWPGKKQPVSNDYDNY